MNLKQLLQRALRHIELLIKPIGEDQYFVGDAKDLLKKKTYNSLDIPRFAFDGVLIYVMYQSAEDSSTLALRIDIRKNAAFPQTNLIAANKSKLKKDFLDGKIRRVSSEEAQLILMTYNSDALKLGE